MNLRLNIFGHGFQKQVLGRNCGVFNLFTKPLGNSILEDSYNLHNPLLNFISFFRWVTTPSSGFLLYALLSSQESIDSFPHRTALVLTFLIAQPQTVKRDGPPSLPYQSRNKRELTLVDEVNFVCKSTPALQHRESHLQMGSPCSDSAPRALHVEVKRSANSKIGHWK